MFVWRRERRAEATDSFLVCLRGMVWYGLIWYGMVWYDMM